MYKCVAASFVITTFAILCVLSETIVTLGYSTHGHAQHVCWCCCVCLWLDSHETLVKIR